MSTLTPNAQRLLRTLIIDGPAYRADLARSLDVTRATVSNLTGTLSEDGWIEEPDHMPGALKNLLGTSPQLGILASVVFLADSCSIALSRLDGRVLKEFTVSNTPLCSALDRLAHGEQLILEALASVNLSTDTLRALHLSVDTQMDTQTGDVYAQRASSRWFGVNPKEYYARSFGIPVYSQNSSRLEGLAEHLWGLSGQNSNLLYVNVSSGVTSGLIVDGIVQSGARGGSGELGHTVYDWAGPLCTCGNTGCLMQYVSIPAQLRDYATASGQNIAWPQYCALVNSNDQVALQIFERAGQILGRALINTCHLLDPETVVLGGEVPKDLPQIVQLVKTVITGNSLPLVGKNVRVIAATLENISSATARAGIESLRGVEELIAACSNP